MGFATCNKAVAAVTETVQIGLDTEVNGPILPEENNEDDDDDRKSGESSRDIPSKYFFSAIWEYFSNEVSIFVSQVVGEALLWTLQDMLKTQCTTQVAEAWKELFSFITKTMLCGLGQTTV